MRWIPTVAASAAVVLLAAACSSGTNGRALPATAASPSVTSHATTLPAPATSSGNTSSTAPSIQASGRPVHVSLLAGDGGEYGIGMPIIAYVDHAITDASAFDHATTVTVNGQPAAGAWYWQRSGRAGQVLEAHYRLRDYWPAHARIHLDLPVKGLPAGHGLVFDDSLTLSIATGAANITTVNGATERMVVTSDGRKVFDFPVSLGAADHPTYTGTKIVMEKDRVEEMKSNPGEAHYDVKVPWSVRLTNSGEFVHAASWNGGNIGVRSTSHGCTNLNVAAAQQYFEFAQIGDVFIYTNTSGPTMPSWDGYGDWNVAWPTWQAGGLLA